MVPSIFSQIESLAVPSPEPALARGLHAAHVTLLGLGLNFHDIEFSSDEGTGDLEDQRSGGFDEVDERLVSVDPGQIAGVWKEGRRQPHPEDTFGPRIEKKFGKPFIAQPL